MSIQQNWFDFGEIWWQISENFKHEIGINDIENDKKNERLLWEVAFIVQKQVCWNLLEFFNNGFVQ